MRSRMVLVPIAAVVVGALSVGVASAVTVAKPTALTATATSASAITLHWTDASTNEIGFEVQRSPANKTAFKKVGTAAVNATSYADSGLAAATAYKYRLRALKNPTGASAFSNVATATTFGGTTDTTKPSVPTGLTGSASSCSQINLKWNAATDNAGGSGVKGYSIWRDGTLVSFVNAPATTYQDDAVDGPASYSYQVQAVDNANNYSDKSTATMATTPSCGGTTLPVPGGFTASATSCGFVVASWSAIFDPNHTYGITKFNLYRNGALVQTVNAPTITAIDSNLSAQTTYSYAVTALDSANHESAKTAAISTTTPACQPASAWAQTFGGSGSATTKSVATDAAGDVIVGGTLHGSVDFGGGPVVAGGLLDIFVAKYSPTHALLWVDHFTSSGSNEEVNGLATDAAGNVYVAGDFVGTINLGGGPLNSAGVRDAFVASLSPTGQYKWAHAFGGPEDDVATSVAVDTSGNPVFTGSFWGTNVDFGGKIMSSRGIAWANDSFVVKYSAANGTNLLGFPTGCFNANANGVAVDSANNIVITGSLGAVCNFGGGLVQPGYTDIYVAKYSPTGAYVWAKSFGSRMAVASQGNAVAVDGSGNVIITGVFPYAVDFGNGPIGDPGRGIWSAFVAKFTASNGTAVWSRAFGNNEAAYGNGVAADSNGNVTVTGTFTGTIDFGGGPLTTPVQNGASVNNAFVAEYSPSGAYLASRRYGEAGYTQGLAVAAGPHSAVVTGFFNGTLDLGFGPTMNPGHNDFYILNTGS